ncbi:hypothetical protein FACS1894105_13820 [Clostridia bacterium]|nr:hypothetical protein FACS1894105_13820 [Clostridia bacterium]
MTHKGTVTLDRNLIDWLLEDNNPAVRHRTRKELLGETSDKQPVIDWLGGKMPGDWLERKGLWRTYFLTAIAECGLTLDDMEYDKETALLLHGGDGKIENNCGDFMHLRALVKLGLLSEPVVAEALKGAVSRQLPDGGFLCLHRLDKLKYTPKSCVKSNMQALMLCAECKKLGIDLPFTEQLLSYFWNHNIFYRTDSPETLILNAREGWRTVDTFHPFEVMRVGLHNIVEAFSALGYGSDARLQEAWELLERRKGEDGKYLLNATLAKSYLPKERVGKPSKWVTFYALLAQLQAKKPEL